MKKYIKFLIEHPLIAGSGIIFAGSFAVNLLNYIFNLIMGRLLSVTDYGLLIPLVALISLLTLFQGSFNTLFAKFAAKYMVNKDHIAERSFIVFSFKAIFSIAFASLVILTILTIPIAHFLHVTNIFLLVLVFLTVFISILSSLPSGILQGHLKFKFLAAIQVSGAIIKILVGVGLVVIGLGVAGGLIGILALFLFPYCISLLYVLKYAKGKKIKEKAEHIDFLQEFKKASGPFLIASFAITILQGSDVIFARHFLTNIEAGQYAAISLMGKAIFYITSPIYFVFFPLIAHKKEKNESTGSTLSLAAVIILLSSVVFTAFYFLYPQIILKIFFPSPAYANLGIYLGFYSLYVLVFSVCYLLFNYFLSMGKTGVYKINVFVVLVYIASLYFFHRSISDFIAVLITSCLLLFILLCIYYKRVKN